MGRPTKYNIKVVMRICERLADGESLRSICRDPAMPMERTVFDWLADDREGFSQLYAHARDLGLDVMADELLEIAANGSDGVARDRLRVDTAKWYLAKRAPKRYGERKEVNVKGDHTVTHFTETVSETDAWIEETLRREEDIDLETPLPH